MTTLKRILVVGTGAMGTQIGLACAIAGFAVTVQDIDPNRLTDASSQIRDLLQGRVAKGRLHQGQVGEISARITYIADLEDAATGVDLVIEAIVEKLAVKRDLFRRLDRLLAPHVIIASNSSGFVPSQLASATTRPDRVCNLHFFNPALVMRGVEIVGGPETSDDTAATVTALARQLGKTPIVLNKEIPGLIANRILNSVRDEAIALLEGGVASAETIDEACRTALGYPMGPFELMDLTGIDIGYYTKMARYNESGDPRDKPSQTVTALVERGDLGRKTGAGFYKYTPAGIDSSSKPMES